MKFFKSLLTFTLLGTLVSVILLVAIQLTSNSRGQYGPCKEFRAISNTASMVFEMSKSKLFPKQGIGFEIPEDRAFSGKQLSTVKYIKINGKEEILLLGEKGGKCEDILAELDKNDSLRSEIINEEGDDIKIELPLEVYSDVPAWGQVVMTNSSFVVIPEQNTIPEGADTPVVFLLKGEAVGCKYYCPYYGYYKM